MHRFTWALLFLATIPTLNAAYAGKGVQIINAPAGQQVDVFTEVNTGGTVFVHVVSQKGSPWADFLVDYSVVGN